MPAESAPELADFQQEAHQRLLAAIDRFSGALLADSVGLGKTHVAAAVARSLARPGKTTIAVVPSSLVRMWRTALCRLGQVRLVTHASMSRGGCPAAGPGGLVIIDEAHAFRNPRTRRYAALARLVAARPVLLLTATPVNNSVWDLYWLLRLFASDSSFVDIGLPDLAAAIGQARRSGGGGRIPALLAAVAVRRSRALVEELHGQVRVGDTTLAFPRREQPRPVPYKLPTGVAGLLCGLLAELELAPWQELGPRSAAWLLRLLLLKRLESSREALRASLLRMQAGLARFLDGLSKGVLLVPACRLRPGADHDQLELTELVAGPLPPSVAAGKLGRSAHRDLDRIRSCLLQLDAALKPDPKSGVLIRLLGRELAGRPVLLFSEFRETAEYLWLALRDRTTCALIHGGGAWLGSAPASRRAVIERFAPVANGAPAPPARERVRLLIATDVLAEGLNLQDAADVVSYDLPWNPVRLVQRLGRIDRLGSPHESVRSWYFTPERDLEQMLRLLRRIRAKLGEVSRTIGADAPVLALPARAATVRRLSRGESEPFLAAARDNDRMLEIEERLRHAWRRAQRAGDALDGLPLAREVPSKAVPDAKAPGSAAPRAPASADNGRVTIPGAVLPLPSDLMGGARRGRPRALVFLRSGRWLRAVFVAGRGCFEDDVLAGEVILHALRPTDSLPPPLPPSAGHAGPPASGTPADPSAAHHGTSAVAGAVRRAVRWLEREPRTHSGKPRPHPVRGAHSLRKRLLRLLQDLPGGASEGECERAEVILARLRSPMSVADELALRPLARRSGNTLDELLCQVEQRLLAVAPNAVGAQGVTHLGRRRGGRGGRRPLQSATRDSVVGAPTVAGVFLLTPDPSANGAGEPALHGTTPCVGVEIGG